MPPKPTPAIDRLLRRIDKQPDGCWLWLGALKENGYGVIGSSIPIRRQIYVHRLAYEHFHGLIPDGMEVMHSCDVRNCVNPDHLSVGTHAQNVQSQVDRNRTVKGVDMHWSVKISEDAVREIRRLRETTGATHRSIAERYGLTTSAVEHICHRRRWKHVP